MRKAVFLDRDGVIIKDIHDLTDTNQIELIPNVTRAIRLLNKAKISVIVVTNQPVIAKGLITEKNIEEIHSNLKEMFNKNNAKIDAIYYCPHHPNANLEKYRQICKCRKPEPGMLLQSAKDFNINIKDSYMVGDRNSDIVTGKKAFCKSTILLLTGKNEPIRSDSVPKSEIDNVKSDYVCKDLFGAVELILKLEKKK